jgi:hypothetical protein
MEEQPRQDRRIRFAAYFSGPDLALLSKNDEGGQEPLLEALSRSNSLIADKRIRFLKAVIEELTSRIGNSQEMLGYYDHLVRDEEEPKYFDGPLYPDSERVNHFLDQYWYYDGRLENFRYVLSLYESALRETEGGKPIQESEKNLTRSAPWKKINWLGSIPELDHLFQALEARNYIEHTDDYYVLLASHFAINGKETTNDNLRKAVHQHRNIASDERQKKKQNKMLGVVDGIKPKK